MYMTEKQREGAIVLVVFTVIVILSTYLFSSYRSRGYNIQYGDINAGPLIIEVACDNQGFNGIYFLPEKTKVAHALKTAGIMNIGALDKKKIDMQLTTGMTVNVDSEGCLNILEMSSAKKLILDIPININQVSSHDLTLISGIGEKTAQKIVAFRRTNGNFKKLEDLMMIPGIKEKKFAKMKKFFCVDCSYLYLSR
jgi:competence ComEA-like helix-hairpin-helix protein